MVAQNFNKSKYTERKIVQWQCSQIKFRFIPTTKIGYKKNNPS